MKRFFCCIAWLLGSPFLLAAFYFCMALVAIFLGPDEAYRHCQPILDQINALAACCSGK